MDFFSDRQKISCFALAFVKKTISADYILTGDKDLLVFEHHDNTSIIPLSFFVNATEGIPKCQYRLLKEPKWYFRWALTERGLLEREMGR